MATTKSIRHQYNYDPGKAKRERFTKPSLTIPDETLSIREILDRFARGIPMENVAKIPVYDGDEMRLPDVRTLDFAEIQTYAEEIVDIRNRHENARADQERAKLEAEAKRIKDLETAAKELTELKAKSTNTP